jgi:integrase
MKRFSFLTILLVVLALFSALIVGCNEENGGENTKTPLDFTAFTLQTEDFDYTKNTVTINKAVVRNSEGLWETKKPKSAAGYRTVKVPGWVMDVIKDAADNGWNPCNADYITNGYKRICKQLGIKNIRFHDLRHYYASSLLALGVPDKYAMARMGHATTNMLKNVYQHRMRDKDKELDATIEAYFDQIPHKKSCTHDSPHEEE